MTVSSCHPEDAGGILCSRAARSSVLCRSASICNSAPLEVLAGPGRPARGGRVGDPRSSVCRLARPRRLASDPPALSLRTTHGSAGRDCPILAMRKRPVGWRPTGPALASRTTGRRPNGSHGRRDRYRRTPAAPWATAETCSANATGILEQVPNSFALRGTGGVLVASAARTKQVRAAPSYPRIGGKASTGIEMRALAGKRVSRYEGSDVGWRRRFGLERRRFPAIAKSGSVKHHFGRDNDADQRSKQGPWL